MPGPLIVIDGPAGAGKSTVARTVAEAIGAALLDTGAIYRGLAYLARERGVDWDDEPGLAAIAATLRIEFQPAAEPGAPQRVLISSDEPGAETLDVTSSIRTPDISDGASRVSRHQAVRAALLDIQRAIAATSVESGHGCVAEGRDMGTVVFPDARHKFFLTASAAARAGRRHKELVARGQAPSRTQVEVEMARRDQRDSSRATAPLQQAKDAALIDSSELDVAAVVSRILAAVDPA
ncbi:Cytidylate kinase [Enhygromyxa salina]|uniref:Cytidylate kinase n=1 Tax=Enhygromyxa salina TaxID=215803 RepID=A0A2S9YH03_9BACT|nr:(d)CMP kinase [Enhygromyxa salina]PRQ04387.1 Cytidylate kinase [Enhygromyxa salina]